MALIYTLYTISPTKCYSNLIQEKEHFELCPRRKTNDTLALDG